MFLLPRLRQAAQPRACHALLVLARTSPPRHRVVMGGRCFAATSDNKPTPSLGFDFSVTADEALESFMQWTKLNTPLQGLMVAGTVEVKPTLLPFYAFDLNVNGRTATCANDAALVEYAGHDYSTFVVQACASSTKGAVPFDAPRHMRSAGNKIDAVAIDPWSMLPSNALRFVNNRLGDAQVSVRSTYKVHFPAYVFTYTYMAQRWPVVVCGRTGRASGLRHTNPLEALVRTVRSGQVPTIVWIMVFLPRLIPPLGIGMMLWSAFRILQPMFADRILAAVKRTATMDPRSIPWLSDLHGTYDPGLGTRQTSYQSGWTSDSDWSHSGASSQQQQGQQRQQQQQRSTQFKQPPPSQSHYQVLGLSQSATAPEIKEAYRRKVLLTHPDQNKSPTAAAELQRVVEAYRVLSNGSKKREYDARL